MFSFLLSKFKNLDIGTFMIKGFPLWYGAGTKLVSYSVGESAYKSILAFCSVKYNKLLQSVNSLLDYYNLRYEPYSTPYMVSLFFIFVYWAGLDYLHYEYSFALLNFYLESGYYLPNTPQWKVALIHTGHSLFIAQLLWIWGGFIVVDTLRHKNFISSWQLDALVIGMFILFWFYLGIPFGIYDYLNTIIPIQIPLTAGNFHWFT